MKNVKSAVGYEGIEQTFVMSKNDAIQQLRTALKQEQYEHCAEYVGDARRAGVDENDIKRLLSDPRSIRMEENKHSN